jgi:predicted transcriptional regulator
MKTIDDLILDFITDDYKTVKEISTALNFPYVRVAVRIKKMRKFNMVTSILSTENIGTLGIKPLKYKKKI